ncbi:MAG: ABC-F family ATP-binding cassette domain-containing protein [Candidatus Pacebacteria bacterium]|nr:ABC-F family ATP-binding cassette domain-containing protein [Candidatus Paceibacterota bacterium]MBP9851147.1 ABC-F family ATP-binding cassette domain-containing protein [Candidatus Paceibacterota bacterium]
MSQGKQDTIVRFDKVSYEWSVNKPILEEVSFSIRRGSKLTLMGQNGAGKSTIFGLISGMSVPESGIINIMSGVSIASSRQVIPRSELELTVREFFEQVFPKKVYDIDPKIDEILEVVNLKGHEKVHDRVMKSFSGGQQARLLLAQALIQDPDLLLLDEPTNNLDKAGIKHLTDFLVNYKKTVLVISHDAEFLNAFTEGVLYLDVYTRKIEQYVGNYHNVVKDITARKERENMKNAQLEKQIQAKKDQANVFAHKGGRLRLVARRMRELAEDLEEEIVDVRKEDKTIKNFQIQNQPDLIGEILNISSFTTMKSGKIVKRVAHVSLKKNMHLLLQGPNGIGKSTLLEKLASGKDEGSTISEGIRVGYYRQDFSTLNFDHSVYESLASAMLEGGEKLDEEKMRAIAAGFLITGEMIRTKIGSLSEGQKGLVAFARLVMIKPGLLILDEPTNHINFRHLPIIAKALDSYAGAMILVSHVPEFVKQIRIDEVLDLEK